MKYLQHAVVIGRFQPFHRGHASLIQLALDIADNVTVILGSAHAAPNVKNPFTVRQREAMIYSHFDFPENLSIIPVRDYLYNDALWVTELQTKVSQQLRKSSNVGLVGYKKDASSYYLDLFPGWRFVEHGPTHLDLDGRTLSATEVRAEWFGTGNDIWMSYVPTATQRVMNGFSRELFTNLSEEYAYLRDYPKTWGHGPFITVDAVCTTRGHVLVVERGKAPGRGLLALPGGFLNADERCLDGAVRELIEETHIANSPYEIKRTLAAKEVFDHPLRSERGRTVTHAFHFDLDRLAPLADRMTLPYVKGSDDAAAAFWMPLADVLEQSERFYEDHQAIIRYFVTRF